ncbi:hypothetical protein Taro_039077 [Colocasia esculenta]|uniref:Uncharacterized protein n=1 Tax=Colocasia esculenta TaxID=4460 RepID=A0A843WP34_COLES|nr:hypothetical protein [Colocasia esculenta]
MSFTTCWGRVKEFLVAGELWNDHKKVIFFPCSSAMTYATYPLGVEQRYYLLASRKIQHSQIRSTLSGKHYVVDYLLLGEVDWFDPSCVVIGSFGLKLCFSGLFKL